MNQGRLASHDVRRDRHGAGRGQAARVPRRTGDPFGFYSDAQQSLPQFGTKAVPPALRINMKLVGLASLNSEIVEDDVDTLPTFIPLTPAFARQALAQTGLSGALTFGIKTSGGTPRCRSSTRARPPRPPRRPSD